MIDIVFKYSKCVNIILKYDLSITYICNLTCIYIDTYCSLQNSCGATTKWLSGRHSRV